uniref:Uncharacterized protein n=1 Tax=Anopheles merus TaxID=30066 RepID=A0A182UQG0_ANOME
MYFTYDAERHPRNHSDFCDDKYPSHVNKRTPLTRLLGCDMVADFVSLWAEDMHPLYKGVEANFLYAIKSSAVMIVERLVGGRTDWFGTAKEPGLKVVLAETEAGVVLVMVVVVVADAGQSASSNGSTSPLMNIFL